MVATTKHDWSELWTMEPAHLGTVLIHALNLAGTELMKKFASAGGTVTAEWSKEGVVSGQCVVRAVGPAGMVLANTAISKTVAKKILLGQTGKHQGTWKWTRSKVASVMTAGTHTLAAEASSWGALKKKKGIDWFAPKKTHGTPDDLGVPFPKEAEAGTKTGTITLEAAEIKETWKGPKDGPAAKEIPIELAEIAKVFFGGADTEGGGKKQGGEDMNAFPIEEMLTAETVLLREAESLYQPVCGTSPGSRYFAMGLSESLNVGVRYKSDSMAIRIEGPLLAHEAARKTLKRFGFSNVSEKYGSMHLPTGGEETMARKLLGSVLMGLGLEWKHPLPDLSLIEGKGS